MKIIIKDKTLRKIRNALNRVIKAIRRKKIMTSSNKTDVCLRLSERQIKPLLTQYMEFFYKMKSGMPVPVVPSWFVKKTNYPQISFVIEDYSCTEIAHTQCRKYTLAECKDLVIELKELKDLCQGAILDYREGKFDYIPREDCMYRLKTLERKIWRARKLIVVDNGELSVNQQRAILDEMRDRTTKAIRRFKVEEWEEGIFE